MEKWLASISDGNIEELLPVIAKSGGHDKVQQRIGDIGRQEEHLLVTAQRLQSLSHFSLLNNILFRVLIQLRVKAVVIFESLIQLRIFK